MSEKGTEQRSKYDHTNSIRLVVNRSNSYMFAKEKLSSSGLLAAVNYT